uniref:Uncharacterized protein n=1 Tax=viral metagenome TaxID=1070528 RepID=A0A6C0M1U6_9ZZZZ
MNTIKKRAVSLLNDFEWITVNSLAQNHTWFYEINEEINTLLEPFITQFYNIASVDIYTKKTYIELLKLEKDMIEFINKVQNDIFDTI